MQVTLPFPSQVLITIDRYDPQIEVTSFDENSPSSIFTASKHPSKLQLSTSTFGVRNYHDDIDKENINSANLISRQKHSNQAIHNSSLLKEVHLSNVAKRSLQNQRRDLKPKSLYGIKAPCLSPQFNGGYTSPSTSRNLNTMKDKPIRKDSHRYENYPLEDQDRLSGRNIDVNVYKSKGYNDLGSTPKLPRQANDYKQLEEGNIRRSMSLEDLRLGKKGFAELFKKPAHGGQPSGMY